jgi:hypothetical protein
LLLAQAVAELEGKVTSMPMTGTGPATTITSLKIFNSNIALKPATTFATPTRDGMTANDIGVCNRRPFAGMLKTSNTMVGGTGIVVGTSADSTGTSPVSVVTADTVFLEPAENVLLGRITKVPTFDTVVDPVTGVATKSYAGGTLEIEGTNVVVLGARVNGHFPPIGTVAHNPCLPGLGVKNDVGFPIPPDDLAKDAEAAAEGWYGEDNSSTPS